MAGWSVGEPMTAAELVVYRESLGLTGAWIAKATGTGPRTERRWEAGEYGIPAETHATVAQLLATTDSAVRYLVGALRLLAHPGVVLLRTDQAYKAACTDGSIVMPARWHRAVAARAAMQIPTLMLAFEGEHAPQGDWLRPVISVADFGTRLDDVRYATTRLPAPS
jgi:hypothetical protein